MKRTISKSDDLKVFISSRESKCDECHEDLGKKAWITLIEENGALCLSRADLDHLVFLASGDATLCRRRSPVGVDEMARRHRFLKSVLLDSLEADL